MTEEINIEPEVAEELDIIETTLTPVELEAQADGWTTKEEFVENGGDPENWVTAKEYNRYGNLMKSSNEKYNNLERSFKEQLGKVNQFHDLQLQATIKSLTAQRKEAIESGDSDEFENLDGQLNAVKALQATPTQTVPPEVAAWDARNPWINDTKDPRSTLAKALFSAAIQQTPTAPMGDILKTVDKQLYALNPHSRREQPATTETGKAAAKSSHTWSDLTSAEQAFYEQADGMFKSKADFIKTAINARVK